MGYGIWGATALPNSTCFGPFTSEDAAVNCAFSEIVKANVGPYPKWCDATLDPPQYPPWTTYAAYNGWNTHEWRRSRTFTWRGREYLTGACIPSPQIGYIQIVRDRLVRCPTSHPYWINRPDGKAICYRLARNTDESSCTKPEVGNPVRVSDRSKVLVEVDYESPTNPLLRFERRYRSDRQRDLSMIVDGFGGAWKSSFNRSIRLVPFASPPRAAREDADDGVQSFFESGPGVWSPAPEVAGKLRPITDANGTFGGWVYSGAREVEEFDAFGRLVRVTAAHGPSVTLAYFSSRDIRRISDPFGRVLSFEAAHDDDGGKYAAALIDPSGHAIRYFFDDAGPNFKPSMFPRIYNLATVVFQDGSTRLYHNGEASRFVIPDGTTPNSTWMFNMLTGVTDERGVRFGNYTYDVSGRVISSEQAGGAMRHVFSQIPNMEGTTVTDPLGTVRQYLFFWDRLQSVSQPPGAGSAACSSGIAYDYATGLPTDFQQFNGNLSCIQYDTMRRLPVRRLEGQRGTAAIGYCSASYFNSPPAGARVISTQWHPDWRLPTRSAEPNRITTIVYNGQGASCAPSTVLVDGKPPAVVCSRSEQATTDATGALGFGAGLTGTARTWTYTYTTYGRVLTATDPNGKTTTTTYYADDDPDLGRRGNVATVTNAANHVTRLAAYNLHGQPTQIVDPNGLVTDLTYDLRLRLTSRKVGTELTTFTYDPRGLLTNVALPDGASLTYSYDAAHRLVAIADQQGSRIDYTLDAMGNRITERATDNGGTLVRNIQRSIDALNRVQQVVGAN